MSFLRIPSGRNPSHIFGSSNRKNSTKYKMLIGLCAEHHRGNQSPHGNREIDLMLKRMGQTAFERTGTRAEFIKILERIIYRRNRYA